MKVLALSLLTLVLILQYRLWVSDSGMREVWRLRREVAAQQNINEQLKERNRTLAGEVQDLKKGKSAIEERARTDLGMIGTNETFFQVAPAGQAKEVQPASGSPGSDNSGSAAIPSDKTLLTSHKATRLGDPATFNGTQAGSH